MKRKVEWAFFEAKKVFDCLTQKFDQFDLILPTAEGQVRPLTKLEPQQQAVEEVGGVVPTGSILKDNDIIYKFN